MLVAVQLAPGEHNVELPNGLYYQPANSAAAASGVATAVSNTSKTAPTLTLASVTGIAVGQQVTGPGLNPVAGGATVEGISSETVTLTTTAAANSGLVEGGTYSFGNTGPTVYLTGEQASRLNPNTAGIAVATPVDD
jgi:hypothetical protein